MLMKMRSKMQNQKGFTLVELMVVVVILGILVAIAVPVYNSVTTKAEKSAVASNLRVIDGAIMQYQAAEDTGDDVTVEQATTMLQKWPEGPKGVKYTIDDNNRGAIEDAGTVSWGLKKGDNVEDVEGAVASNS